VTEPWGRLPSSRGTIHLPHSYINDQFPEEHVPTVLDVYNTDVTVNKKGIKLVLCDTAGQDDYSRLRPLGYKEASVFILCYSVADPSSLKSID